MTRANFWISHALVSLFFCHFAGMDSNILSIGFLICKQKFQLRRFSLRGLNKINCLINLIDEPHLSQIDSHSWQVRAPGDSRGQVIGVPLSAPCQGHGVGQSQGQGEQQAGVHGESVAVNGPAKIGGWVQMVLSQIVCQKFNLISCA